MTILRLKIRLIYTESMQKKLGGERGYLALEDLRIKSKFLRYNMSICEVGQSGERKKNPRGRRKKRKKARAGRLGPGLKHHLGAIDHGAKLRAELDARIYGVEHGAKIYGAALDAKIYGAELPAM